MALDVITKRCGPRTEDSTPDTAEMVGLLVVVGDGHDHMIESRSCRVVTPGCHLGELFCCAAR
ncbi:MAG: hypothetical protein EBS20_06175 [Actinobacteria bacterium]|nr:hypothetical protein [Actinomycetota bacterium]